MKCSRQRPKSYNREKAGTFQQIFALIKMVKFSYPEAAGFLKKTKIREISIKCNAPTYLLLPLGKRGSKWGGFHWAIGGV